MMKFARNVKFQIKEGQTPEFTRIFSAEVLPLLKKQNGFQEELTLVNKESAVGISVWKDRASAEAYHATTYPKVLEKLSSLLTGTPRVDTYDVAASTLLA